MGLIRRWLGIPPTDPPTEKQLSYARQLRIENAELYSKDELSTEIDRVKSMDRPTSDKIRYAENLGIAGAAMLTDSEIDRAIEKAKRAERERLKQDSEYQKKEAEKRKRKERRLAKRNAARLEEFGADKIAVEEHWQFLCSDPDKDYALVVFERRKKRKVEVLCLDSASLDDKGRVRIECSGPEEVPRRRRRVLRVGEGYSFVGQRDSSLRVSPRRPYRLRPSGV